MRIGFVGTHSTGKTTLLEKIKESGILNDHEFVTSISRKLKAQGLKINKEADEKSQLALLDAYMQTLGSENFVCDRSLLDPLAYTKYQNKIGKIPTRAVKVVQNTVFDNVHLYDLLFYFPIDFDLVEDGVRDSDKDYRKEIDKILRREIKKSGVKVYEIKGTTDERFEKFREIIEDYKSKH